MKLDRIIETCLYVRDLEAAERFYTTVLGLKVFQSEKDRHVFFKCATGMLLIFNPDRTMELGANIPPHGAYGQGHVAFAAESGQFSLWRQRLEEQEISIEAEIAWPRGGISIYFRDPAGNSVEITSPDTWGFSTSE